MNLKNNWEELIASIKICKKYYYERLFKNDMVSLSVFPFISVFYVFTCNESLCCLIFQLVVFCFFDAFSSFTSASFSMRLIKVSTRRPNSFGVLDLMNQSNLNCQCCLICAFNSSQFPKPTSVIEHRRNRSSSSVYDFTLFGPYTTFHSRHGFL